MSALIYCPFPDRESARALSAQLLDERLIACANLLGEIETIFDWEGQRESAAEVGVLLKTDAGLLDAAVNRIADLHPYETPAVLGWKCDAAAPVTSEWLRALGG